MTAAAPFRQADIERTMKAARKAGVRDYVIRLPGGAEIIVGQPIKPDSGPVELD